MAASAAATVAYVVSLAWSQGSVTFAARATGTETTAQKQNWNVSIHSDRQYVRSQTPNFSDASAKNKQHADDYGTQCRSHAPWLRSGLSRSLCSPVKNKLTAVRRIRQLHKVPKNVQHKTDTPASRAPRVKIKARPANLIFSSNVNHVILSNVRPYLYAVSVLARKSQASLPSS